MIDHNALAGIVRRLNTDKIGSVDPVRLHQNNRRAAEAIGQLLGEIGDLNVAGLQRDATIKALRAELDDANAAVTRLSNSPRATVKRS